MTFGLLSFAGAPSGNTWTTVNPVLTTTQLLQQGSGYSGTGSRIIYVSSSTGSDSNTGTEASPVATAAHGATLIRNNSSDQLLFKCGDTWTNDTVTGLATGRFEQAGVAPTVLSGDYVTGSTIKGPILIGSYGTGARPIFRCPIGANPGGVTGYFIASETDTDAINVAIIGIEVYAYTRDPTNAAYVGAATAAANNTSFGMWWATAGAGYNGLILIEDCIVNYFNTNIIIQGPLTGTSPNQIPVLMPVTFALRRNIIINSYCGASTGHSQGVGGTTGVGTLYDIENFFDHNGWNEDAGLIAQTPGTGATIFNRNLYDGNEGITQLGTVTRVSQGSIHARGSSNSQFRSGCNLSDGLFFKNNVGGIDLGENYGTDAQSATVNNTTPGPFTVQRVVVLESAGIAASNASAASPGGAGIQLSNIENVTLNNNIVANCDTSSTNSIAINWTPTGSGNTVSGNVVTNLIAFKINTAYTSASQTSQVDVSSGTNFVDLTGANTGASPEPFPHPNPTASGATSLLDDYWVSLGNSIGSAGGLDFLTQCAARSRGTWDRRYSAYGANDYIQQTCFNTSYKS